MTSGGCWVVLVDEAQKLLRRGVRRRRVQFDVADLPGVRKLLVRANR